MQLQNKLLVILVFMFLATSAQATPSYQQSKFDRVTPWNKITDYAATLGKNEIEKREALRQRKTTRKKKRIKTAQEKSKKEQEKRFKGLKRSYISR